MPWTETDVMDLRMRFVTRVLRGTEDFSTVCREFGITRRTGYKWKDRFLKDGKSGLRDRSRRPRKSPGELKEDVVCQMVKLKLAHRGWGPRKIRAVLERSLSKRELPSESSFKRVFGKAGLITRRRRIRKDQGTRLQTPVRAERPNQVWTIDFKGWWRTQDRCRFEPLTIRDDFSRYVLCAQALESSRTDAVVEQMKRVFTDYGLPEVLRSDNGSPFAARRSPLGLSRLSAWWLTLGINLDRIEPGRPDQNGGHERMHRDMAFELERNSKNDMITQQAELNEWRHTFNEERPHEALGMRVPKELYEASHRLFDPSPIELEYPKGYLVRKVSPNGVVRLYGASVSISEALCGFDVGLESMKGDQEFAVWFCRVCLGSLDMTIEKFKPVLNERDHR